MSTLALVLLAWAFERVFGWPSWLHARIRHPVVWIGALVDVGEQLANSPGLSSRAARWRGLFIALTVIIITTAVTAIAMALIEAVVPLAPAALIIEALLASSLLASRALYDHVYCVWQPLADGDVESARTAVGHIVGRDTGSLGEPAIARAALESLAENASDGVVAPLFWAVLFGLPGMAAYKAINTLDSMIGHRTVRHEHFGRFAARLDDATNLLPARLTGWIFCLAGGQFAAVAIMRRDARQHRSPNAGWPESAMAGALGIRLSGPRRYGQRISEEPWLNGAGRDATAADLLCGLALYRRAMVLLFIALGSTAIFAYCDGVYFLGIAARHFFP